MKVCCQFFSVSGKAIKHAKEVLFTGEAGMRRGIPKVLVVITDGRSQDDVNKVSREMQLDGKTSHIFLFPINYNNVSVDMT